MWQSVVKERQDTVIHVTLWIYQGSKQKCLCASGTSRVLTTIKESAFCNFDLTFLLCCLIPLPRYPQRRRGSLEGWVQRLWLIYLSVSPFLRWKHFHLMTRIWKGSGKCYILKKPHNLYSWPYFGTILHWTEWAEQLTWTA